MTKCNSCQGDIDSLAKICNHCRSYQNRLRRCSIEYLGPIISLFVALPAICAVSWQLLNYLSHGRSDDVAIKLVQVDEDEQRLVFAVSNTGGRNAMLRSANIFFDANLVAQNAMAGWALDLPVDLVLPADNQRQLDLFSTGGRLPSIASEHQSSTIFGIHIVIVRSNDSLQEIDLSYRARKE